MPEEQEEDVAAAAGNDTVTSSTPRRVAMAPRSDLIRPASSATPVTASCAPPREGLEKLSAMTPTTVGAKKSGSASRRGTMLCTICCRVRGSQRLVMSMTALSSRRDGASQARVAPPCSSEPAA